MVVSLRRMSAGDGYKYLLKTVVAGDGDRSLSTPLTRYYAETGTPPGRWLGSAVRDVGLNEGAEVTETQLELLIGHGRHPVTGDKLGQAYPQYSKESGKKAVAGFDLTFSIPKSASVLWAVSDAGTQAIIADAHHAAVRDVFDFLERELAATRTGANAENGAVAQVETTGFIATAYDHYDSRASGPHLHAHVVISNKVLTVLDGKWRSLDSRALHAWTVALSELHQAVFADHLTRALGVTWEARPRGRDRNPDWAVRGVPQSLVKRFSSRAAAVDVAADELIAAYVAKYGRRPGRGTLNKIRNQASLATRPVKHVHSLAKLTAQWRQQASEHLGRDTTEWATSVTANGPQRVLRADDVPLDVVAEVAATVLAVVAEKRSTWRRHNLYAETARQTMGWRFASTGDREAVTGMVVDAAERGSLRLTPPDLASVPARFSRADSSVFRPKHSVVFSSEALLAAEDRLLDCADVRTAPTVDMEVVDAVSTRRIKGQRLSPEQSQAIATIATDARQLDLLVGPAGAGKTTAMRALREVWTSQHGNDSVVGLAPSAAAAQVLADDLAIACENTAKWLCDHDHGAVAFSRGQLVIVDEAALAGTLTLDRITAHAAEVRAKVLLVGDWAQLQSVDAGGAFAMLAAARHDAPELTDIHRFTNRWERTASLGLRHGRAAAIDDYLVHRRVRSGATEKMLDAAYRAWESDVSRGRASVLVADTTNAANDLNARAQEDRIAATDSGSGVELESGLRAYAGDLIITRRNDRRLRTPKSGWVRNGDRWTVVDVRSDRSLVVKREGRRIGGAVVLPASYVAEHVDLGYAVTAHRAQGLTVDTSHVVVASSTTRENLYVAMTRGREMNVAYVALDQPDEAHGAVPGPTTAREALLKVVANVGAEPSAHLAIAREQAAAVSIAQLAAEYETIAAAAQRDRWATAVRQSGLSSSQVEAVTASDAFGPLCAELRRAEANGCDIDRILPAAVARHGFNDADDVAAVLRHRVSLATSASRGQGRRQARLIVGLVPEALGPMATDMRQALDERRDLMEQRVTALVDGGRKARATWLRDLGERPVDRYDRSKWDAAARTVAAYRDRYGIDERRPLGERADSDAQLIDRARALASMQRASDLSGIRGPPDGATPVRL